METLKLTAILLIASFQMVAAVPRNWLPEATRQWRWQVGNRLSYLGLSPTVEIFNEKPPVRFNLSCSQIWAAKSDGARLPLYSLFPHCEPPLFAWSKKPSDLALMYILERYNRSAYLIRIGKSFCQRHQRQEVSRVWAASDQITFPRDGNAGGRDRFVYWEYDCIAGKLRFHPDRKPPNTTLPRWSFEF